jgi:hypothetical protein
MQSILLLHAQIQNDLVSRRAFIDSDDDANEQAGADTGVSQTATVVSETVLQGLVQMLG